MKYFVATDIHGSAFWAQKITDKFRICNADVLVILGDVYNHGPRNPFPQDYAPLKVAEILNRLSDRLLVIQGNCDSEVDQMISDFLFVKENFVFVGQRKVLFTHGHVHNKDNLPVLACGDVVMYGHFHVNELTETKGVLCVNVSSCSLPKQNAAPAYAILDESGVTLYDFDDNEIDSRKF